MGVRATAGPYCYTVPGNTQIELTAEPQTNANASMDIVVLVPGNGPKGYSPVTLKPSADPNSRRTVFTAPADFQLLIEFHEGRTIRTKFAERGVAARNEANIELVSRGQSLRVRWPAPTHSGGTAGPGNIRVTILGLRADTITDRLLAGNEDEVYVNVFRGVGVFQRHTENITLDDHARKGKTTTLNKVLYQGPTVLADITYVGLLFMEDDDSSNDDVLGDIRVIVNGGQIRWSGGRDEGIESEGPFAGARRFHLDGSGSNYKFWLKAELF